MTNIDLDTVNHERRRKGLPPLNSDQARKAVQEHTPSSDSGFDTTGFLIGYMTGIPMPSAGGIMGAALHHSSFTPPSDSYSSGSDSSWDSGSSSSDSSSSSSSDSGSSSSGGGSD